MARYSSFSFEELPNDVFEEITRALLGWDLFQLSHASPWLLSTLSRQEIWQARVVTPPEPAGNAKKYYVQARSLRFQGQRSDPEEQKTRCSGVEMPIKEIIQTASSVTISTWFSLLPPVDGVFSGGIILGAQSVHQATTQAWANYHQQFIHIDREGSLYCTLLDNNKRPVATHLQYDRWYHLTLTYYEQMQHVYLDGELVSIEEGSLHHELRYMWHSQVGTGCISGNAVGEPSEGYCGWYGFHGAIYDFRVWTSALSPDEIKSLGSGGATNILPASSQLHGRGQTGPVEHISTSSPIERVFVSTEAATRRSVGA